MERSPVEIETLIREEKRLSAVESQEEAWAEAIASGIEPEIVAEAAMSTALVELQRALGEAATLTLIERMRDRAVAGEFATSRTQH